MDLFDYAEKKKKAQREGAPQPLGKQKASVDKKSIDNADDTHVWTVSALSVQIRSLLEGQFSTLVVEGEVSGLKRAASGHIYFDLKDAQNVIKCVLWRSQALSLSFDLKDGDAVLLKGKLTAYGAQSTYQITVQTVRKAGVGALMAQFDALKAKLSAEGLFNPEHKKELPFLPQKVGIITSESGAVIEDMLTILKERFPLPVLFYPARVQGKGAAEEIAAGVHFFNALPKEDRPDVMIVGRGGGSLEDLWSFNEEVLVRALFMSDIPVVSAVGHEPDVTLADYVADMRAPTPTAAAKLVVPERAYLMRMLTETKRHLHQNIQRNIQQHQQTLRYLQARLPKPKETITAVWQRVDEKELRLTQAMAFVVQRAQGRFNAVGQERLNRAIEQKYTQTEKQLAHFKQLLESYSPEGPLKRGYLYAKTSSGEVLRSAKQGGSGERVIAHFYDGKREMVLGDSLSE